MGTLQILNVIQTTSEADRLRKELHALIRGVYETSENYVEVLGQFLDEDAVMCVLSDLKTNNIETDDKASFVDFITQIIKTIEDLPTLSFVFATIPTLDTINQVVDQIEGPQKTLVDYSVNPDIYGGVVILKDGHVYDYSIRQEVESRLEI